MALWRIKAGVLQTTDGRADDDFRDCCCPQSVYMFRKFCPVECPFLMLEDKEGKWTCTMVCCPAGVIKHELESVDA